MEGLGSNWELLLSVPLSFVSLVLWMVRVSVEKPAVFTEESMDAAKESVAVTKELPIATKKFLSSTKELGSPDKDSVEALMNAVTAGQARHA